MLLFDPPQRLEVLASVPDGPPRRFRWRGVAWQVTRAEGPERIAPEWWRKLGGHGANPGLTRDYYRVEEVGGRRLRRLVARRVSFAGVGWPRCRRRVAVRCGAA